MDNEVCKQHSGLVQTIADVKDDTSKQWLQIDAIKNRPPVWYTIVVTLVMTAMGALVGSVLTYAALVVRIATAAKAAQ